MSTLIQAEQTTKAPTNKRTVWRIINIAIILFAFFTPWLRIYGDSPAGTKGQNTFGFQLIVIVGYLCVTLLSEFTETATIPLIGSFLAFIILISIPLYCVLNLLVVMPNTQLIDKPNWAKLEVTLLEISAIGLLLFALVFLFVFQDLLWGYWLTCIGLVSSILLEIWTYPSRRQSSKR